MILIGIIDNGDNEEVLKEAINRAGGQADQIVIVTNKFIGLNGIQTISPDPVDGPYSALLRYSLKNKHDYLYIISSNSFLNNGCVSTNINFLKDWNQLNGIEHYVACATYSDFNFRLTNNREVRQYLESITYNRILKNELVVDNLLIDLKIFNKLSINLGQIKSNIELIFLMASKSLILHNPLPTHSLKYRGQSDQRDIKAKYGGVYLSR